jgi:hypothetical protein
LLKIYLKLIVNWLTKVYLKSGSPSQVKQKGGGRIRFKNEKFRTPTPIFIEGFLDPNVLSTGGL